MKRQWIIYLFRSTAMALGLATLFAFFDTLYWFFELFAHFTMQYIVIAIILLPIAVLCKRWRMMTILLLVLCINGADLWRIAHDYSQDRVACDGPTVHILQSNVYYMNVTIDEAARELQQAAEQADIIILNEFSEAWREREEGRFKKQFPHGYVTWINDNIEKMAIFSRQPFHVQQRSGRVEKNAHLRLLFPSLGLTMFVFHGLTPVNEFAKTERDWELSRIARELKRMHSPSMIIGDFNQTPYATRFQNALREGDLHLAPFPEGIKPTWPDSWYSMPLEIPLDHLLVNLNVRICKREVIPITGSDHSAVMNVLQLLPEKLDFSDQKNVTPPPKMRLKIKTSPAS